VQVLYVLISILAALVVACRNTAELEREEVVGDQIDYLQNLHRSAERSLLGGVFSGVMYQMVAESL
jgi:hypothetical protein